MQKVLNEEKKKEIYTILSVGGTRAMAAHYVGCHPRTIYNEAHRDAKFAEQIRHYEVGPELAFLNTIFNAGTKGAQWRAAKWALERMYPTRYGNRNPRMIAPEEVRLLLEDVVAAFAKNVTGASARRKIHSAVRQLEANATLLPSPRSLRHDP